jgi:manganese/zinc/iron transport system substrate-binding protein
MKTITLTFLATLLVTGCAAGPIPGVTPADLATRKVRVTTTVGMIADIVRNVGGERVEVAGLMAPGVDPHLYKPSVGDVFKLDSADIIFYGGLHLEGRMVDLFEKMNTAGRRAVAVADGIDHALLHKPAEFEGAYDPHIWFDVTLWQLAARHVSKSLIEIDPGSADLYQRNAERYLTELDALHLYVQQQINTIPAASRVLITAHDAFGYFGARYGLEVRGIQGASTATEASANNVRELAQFITDRKIKAIFVESSVPRATIEAVQAAVRSRGWDVRIGGELFADAMGADGTPEGTYVGMVKHNVDTIVSALR